MTTSSGERTAGPSVAGLGLVPRPHSGSVLRLTHALISGIEDSSGDVAGFREMLIATEYLGDFAR